MIDPVIYNKNQLLSALTAGKQTSWTHKLKKVDLVAGETLSSAGQSVQYAYFPVDCIIVVVNSTESGATVCTAMVGFEGMSGIDAILDNLAPSSAAVVQASGTAFRLPASVLAQYFNDCPVTRRILLNYTSALMQQMSQTSLCSRHYKIDQQLCPWILLSLDRMSADTLVVTQELISHLLGVRREGISEAATQLQRAGAI